MRARRKDANQSELVAVYRANGISVVVLAEESLDLLVGCRGVSDLVEVKDGAKSASRQKLTPAETELHATWRGAPIRIVTSTDDVLRHVADLHRRAEWQANGRLACDIPRVNLR